MRHLIAHDLRRYQRLFRHRNIVVPAETTTGSLSVCGWVLLENNRARQFVGTQLFVPPSLQRGSALHLPGGQHVPALCSHSFKVCATWPASCLEEKITSGMPARRRR